MNNYLNTSFYEVSNATEFLKGLQRSIRQLPPEGIFTGDNLFTILRVLSFLDDTAFMQAFARNTDNVDATQQELAKSLIWRSHVITWAAYSCLKLEGDFLECTCYKGTSAKIVCEYLDFNKTDKHYYLYELFESDEGIKQKFVEYPGVHVIHGSVPEILHTEAPEKIAFMHLGINSAAAEIGALELLFDRIVPGGMLLLENYGWLASRAQQQAENDFFAARHYRVLELPTGQGLVIKFN